MTVMTHATERLSEQLHPAIDLLEDKTRVAGQLIEQARHSARDVSAAAELEVRRHPLGSVALAALGAGIVCGVAGCLMGYAAGRCARST